MAKEEDDVTAELLEEARYVGENLWRAQQLGRFSRNRIYKLSEIVKLQQGIWPGRPLGYTKQPLDQIEAAITNACEVLRAAGISRSYEHVALQMDIDVKTLKSYLRTHLKRPLSSF